jgi:hypothetical protein
MGLGSGIREKPIPDPGSRVKKAPDPGGSATLQKAVENCFHTIFLGKMQHYSNAGLSGCFGFIWHLLSYVARKHGNFGELATPFLLQVDIVQEAEHTPRILRRAVIRPAQEVEVIDLTLCRAGFPTHGEVAQDVVFVVHLGYAAYANIPVVFGFVHLGPVARTFRLSCTGANASFAEAFLR